MAKRCGTRNVICPTPRANWWKQALGVDWFNHNTSGGSEPSFDPVTDIPGVRFIYDGDNAVLSGSNIESITNQVTGQANAIKIADGSRPTIVATDLNGHATIDFNGAQGLKINVTDIVAIDMTWFIVFKADATSGATRRPMIHEHAAGTPATNGFSASIVNNTVEFFMRSSTTQAFTDTTGWHVMMMKAKHYGANLNPRVFKIDNGTPVNSITSTFANSAFNLFIGTNTDQTLFFDGKIAEIIGVQDVVTETVEQQVYGYLNTKYGLSVPTTMPEYTFNSGSLTYASTFDPAITNLNYQFSFSGKTFGKTAPMLVLMHGYSDTVIAFTTEIKNRMANLGFYLAIVDMRQRSGAGGTRDSSGREILDIYDAVQKSLTNHPDLTNSEMVNLSGYSGGGGNGIACAAKLPETFGIIVENFGITDYIYDYASTAWFQQATPGGPVQQQLELDILGLADRLPQDYPNESKSRDHRYSAIFNYEGQGCIVHDVADTAVQIVQTDELWKQIVDQSKTGTWQIRVSNTTSGTRLSSPYTYPVTSGDRYNHGYPDSTNPGLIASESFWVTSALSVTRPASKTSGTYRVSGFVKNRKFQLFLGLTTADGKSCEADLVFNYNTNSYTLTPRLLGSATELKYSFTDDIGRVASGTIVGNTPTVFTPA